ncbi:MAG: tail fiber protein [Opitutaceae bacterium]|nr:tail fiber protein [Cytophagales bacterium]
MKLKFTFFALLLSFAVFAQTSDKGYSFQGFAIDPDGKAMGATAITIKFTISPSTGTGGNYAETHSLTTDPFGVFHAVIGKGSKESGSDDFKTLDYTRNGTIYKLKVEVKKTNGGLYTTINEADFNSVPYARKADNGVPVGTIITFAGAKNKVPEGWAICDGTLQDGTNTQWKQLYDVLGTSWGGSGSNFNLPDLRGMFLRGVNDGRNDGYRDPDAGARSALKSGGNTGDQQGTYQGDDNRSHNHSGNTTTNGSHSHKWNFGIEGDDSGSGGSFNEFTQAPGSNTDGIEAAGDHSHNLNINNSGGNESRSRNASVYYIIKY